MKKIGVAARIDNFWPINFLTNQISIFGRLANQITEKILKIFVKIIGQKLSITEELDFSSKMKEL